MLKIIILPAKPQLNKFWVIKNHNLLFTINLTMNNDNKILKLHIICPHFTLIHNSTYSIIHTLGRIFMSF